MIFEKTMKRNKKASFKRTSPSEQHKHAEKSQHACDECDFKTNLADRLTEHKKTAHRVKKYVATGRQTKGATQYCHYWNNKGSGCCS